MSARRFVFDPLLTRRFILRNPSEKSLSSAFTNVCDVSNPSIGFFFTLGDKMCIFEVLLKRRANVKKLKETKG